MNKGKLVSVDFDEPEDGKMVLHIATEGGGICAGDIYWAMAIETDDEVKRLKAEIKQIHKEYGCEVRDPCGTIWQQAARTQEANEKMKSLLQKIAYPRRGTGEEMMSIDDAAKSIQSVFSLEDLEPST